MKFSPPLVSTITATAHLGSPVNIVSTAKYIDVDDTVVGVKLVYAGGTSVIVKGSCKLSDNGRRGFLNQITFLLKVPSGVLIHCKIFHNGSIQITGGKTIAQTLEAWKTVTGLLQRSKGCRSVILRSSEGLLRSHDNLIFASTGAVIGWYSEEKDRIFVDGYVSLEQFEGHSILVSSSYKNDVKEMRTLDGELFGHRRVVFNAEYGTSRFKKHVDIEYGRAYLGCQIVGKEVLKLFPNHLDLLANAARRRRGVSAMGRVLHCFSSFETDSLSEPVESGLSIHMINCYFQAPLLIQREKLHHRFLSLGYYSRFELCVNPGVNLRFYDNEKDSPITEIGICPCTNKGLTCSCKRVSLRCFNSGKIIATGMKDFRQISSVHNFIQRFYDENRQEIQADSAGQ